ncbi:ROK family transcriptional regulator [Lederbergia graminis]|uniref:ROK family transcriptional regulator n=1 Tax=Lederbergia graminis TaxID=735518 RepID=A0ABW0LHS9_9BACI
MYVQQHEKMINRDKVLATLFEHRQLTKLDISRITNLSIPTVTSNITSLIELGIVDEAGVANSTGGRKPKIVRLLPNSRFSIGVEITPTKVKLVIINLFCEIQLRKEFSLDELKTTSGFHRAMIKMADVVQEMIKELHIQSQCIMGIGISVPGTVNREQFVLELAPNLGLKQFSLQFLKDMFPFPLYIENEANAGAFGELMLDKQASDEHTVYVSITEGIGTSIISKDGFYKGNKERAGEFGHMHTGNSERVCSCGRTGCWELFSSETALLNLYKEQTGVEQPKLAEIMERHIAKDEDAQIVVKQYLQNIALGIQNILLAIDPKQIIIGGELAKYSDQLIIELRKFIFSQAVFHNEQDVDINFSSLYTDSSILGAAITPYKQLFLTDEE